MNLTQIRKRSGLTQARLAVRLGIARQTVVRWEAGETIPNGLQMARLSEVLRVSMEDIADAFRLQRQVS